MLVVSSALYYPKYIAENTRAENLAAVLSSVASTTLDARTKEADCLGENNSPDHACTPGAVFPATVATICVSGYSASVRNVPDKVHKAVFAEYGIPYPQPRGSYEVDHLIPLAIGGSNDIANLFPQPAAPAPGFREKDLVEVYLQEQVCAGKVALNAAQVQIADDWFTIYKNLAPADITRLKAKYRNWSN